MIRSKPPPKKEKKKEKFFPHAHLVCQEPDRRKRMDDTICYSIIPNQLPPVAKLKVVDLVYCCSKLKTLINKVRQNYPVLSNSFELSEK
jgi:hypothetical protein